MFCHFVICFQSFKYLSSADMKCLLLLIICLFCAICCILVETQIFRSSCRKDSLMKADGRDKRLVGSAHDIIAQVQVAGLRYCVKHCNGASTCLSVNYKQQSGGTQDPNCQLLKITRTSEDVSFEEAVGWVHYEPILQVNENKIFKLYSKHCNARN